MTIDPDSPNRVDENGQQSPSMAVDGAVPLAEVEARARALEADPSFPRRYVEQVRAATAWLGAAAPPADDVRRAALLLDRQAAIHLEPPTGSPSRARRLIKLAVGRLLGWYVRFLGQQVSALGHGAARLGFAAAGRIERLEAGAAGCTDDRAAIHEELAALRARVAELEAALRPDLPR